MFGYAGKILYVNVSNGNSRTEPIKEDFAKNYIGGTGFGIKTLLDNQKSNIDAFDPENPIIYALGPFTGTLVPTSGSKFGVFAKSPQSNLLGESYSTGRWGAELKFAGYDILVIKGRAEKPVYLWIDDDSVQLMDASNIWGKSTWDTEDIIKEELGDESVRVSTIGPGGENLVRFACLINDHFRAAGRTGLGAVMGSKKLKAVAVRGSNDVKVADMKGTEEFCNELHERCRGSATEKYRSLGTPANVLSLNSQAAMPTRNYQSATFEGAEKISGEFLNTHFVAKVQGCTSCAMRCEHVAVVPEGPYMGATSRVEYEPLMAFGPYCGVDRLDAIIKSIELCDIYGIDAISSGIVVGFAMECFEKGFITKDDLGGLELMFGNHEAMVELIKKIALRQNIGNVLAEGVLRASKKIGKGSEEFAMQIKGVEMTGYDVRGLKTAGLGYLVSRRGADHQRHGSYGADLAGTVNRFKAEKGRGKIVMSNEDNYCVFDSLILCKFSRGIWKGYDEMAKIYTMITGIPLSGNELQVFGERASNLGRIYNIREGMTRKDDNFPKRIFNLPIPDGVAKGSKFSKDEVDLLLDDYYDVRGWTKDGIPKPEKLKDLKLEEYNKLIKGGD